MTSPMWGLKGELRTKSEEGEVLCVQGQGVWGWCLESGGVLARPDCGILGLSSSWFERFLGVRLGLSIFFFFRDARLFLSFCGFFLFLSLGAQGF